MSSELGVRSRREARAKCRRGRCPIHASGRDFAVCQRRQTLRGWPTVTIHVRPGGRRSWWLREALAADAGEPCPPLAGGAEGDVVIVGGGFTGMWTAYFLTELEPAARVVLLEQDICGGGPSGRNGGF